MICNLYYRKLKSLTAVPATVTHDHVGAAVPEGTEATHEKLRVSSLETTCDSGCVSIDTPVKIHYIDTPVKRHYIDTPVKRHYIDTPVKRHIFVNF